MSKAGNVAATATIFALALTNPTVRRTTAKLLRKAASFLDDKRPLPVAPPPMWTESAMEEEDSAEELPRSKSRTRKMSLKEYSERNSLSVEPTEL